MRIKNQRQQQKLWEQIAKQMEEEEGRVDVAEVWRRYNLKYGDAKNSPS